MLFMYNKKKYTNDFKIMRIAVSINRKKSRYAKLEKARKINRVSLITAINCGRVNTNCLVILFYVGIFDACRP
jgi:hypothetical protein